MPEYIEREALLEDISESVVFTVRKGQPSAEIRGANKVIDRIKAAPTADVVKVVRCKECKYITPLMGKSPFCFYACSHNKGLGDNVSENDFCSYGKRKEGAEK